MTNSTLRPAVPCLMTAGLLLIAAMGPAAAQSFDCAKATTAAEIAVCDNEQLAAADLELARIYKEVLDQSSDPATLKTEQREWIVQRDACGGDRDCLTGAYARRHDELGLSLTAGE